MLGLEILKWSPRYLLPCADFVVLKVRFVFTDLFSCLFSYTFTLHNFISMWIWLAMGLVHSEDQKHIPNIFCSENY